MKIITQERGWAGHFICAHRCRFRRNTLITSDDFKVVVSTVGCLEEFDGENKFREIGCGRHYETMAFMADEKDTRYHDANTSLEVPFDSPWCISILDADDKANEMHDAVVQELVQKIQSGSFTKITSDD